jgi:hypothetical protein
MNRGRYRWRLVRYIVHGERVGMPTLRSFTDDGCVTYGVIEADGLNDGFTGHAHALRRFHIVRARSNHSTKQKRRHECRRYPYCLNAQVKIAIKIMIGIGIPTSHKSIERMPSSLI